MEEVRLDVQIRSQIGRQKVKAVREDEDMIPAIVYGLEKNPTPVKFDRRIYEKIRRQHHGEIVFHLNVFEGESNLRDYSAVVKEEQVDVVTGRIIHVDFKRISLKDKIDIRVPLTASGDPVGVKKGGSLDHVLWELDVVCLPTNIPEEIKVDVGALDIGDSIHVKDIVLPAGVITKHDPEAIVFLVVPPMREEEPVEIEEGAEPEVIKKAKAEGKADEKPAES